MAAGKGVSKPFPPLIPSEPRSPITTHMLDTSLGRPAEGVPVTLQRLYAHSSTAWETLARKATDANGRVHELLPPSDSVPAGRYR